MANLLESEAPRLLALVLVTARNTAGVSCPRVVQDAVVQITVSSVWLAVLVEVIGVEVAARLAEAGLLVGAVQRDSIVVASVWVVWAREEVVTHAVLGSVNTFAAAVLWWLWWVWLRGWWDSDVGAVIAVCMVLAHVMRRDESRQRTTNRQET